MSTDASVLDFFPDYRDSNPFQDMLFAALPQRGIEVRPVADLGTHLATATGTLSLHWTAPILHRARGPFEAYRLAEQFLAEVRDFRGRGGRLVWTVHNVLPHDARYRTQEMLLARGLAEEADLIHVLARGTRDAVADYYRLDPARTVLVEHSSYRGVYPDSIDRAEARRRLGLAEDVPAIVTVGGIRLYKGLDRLIDVVERLRRGGREVRLLMAGRPGSDAEIEEFVRRVESRPWITARLEYVPDDELQVWMHAGDIAVLPYLAVLNSGAFMLAQTFGLPTVAPRAGALRELEGRPQVRLFAPADDDSLGSTIAELLDAVAEDRDALELAALELAAERDPAVMADRFAEAVAPLVRPDDRPHQV